MRYLVIREEKCPECRGSGVVIDPEWEELYQAERPLREKEGRLFTIEEIMAWWRERGYYHEEDLPPEEIACYECKGEGKLRKEVPLEEALRDLGLLKGEPGPEAGYLP